MTDNVMTKKYQKYGVHLGPPHPGFSRVTRVDYVSFYFPDRTRNTRFRDGALTGGVRHQRQTPFASETIVPLKNT